MAKVEINQTQKIGGVVTNSKQGLVNMDGVVEGTTQFRSMALSKYPDGTRLELTFRITGKGQRQLTSHEEILPTDRFRLVVIDIDESDVTLQEVIEWAAEALRVSKLEIPAANKKISLPVTMMVGLTYKDASTYREGLNSKADGKCHFDIIKHTEEDMPAVVSSGVEPESVDYVGQIYIPEHIRPLFSVGARVMEHGEQFNVLLLGESGYGKTSLFEALAQHLGVPFLRQDCSLIQDTTEWFGEMGAESGSTYFRPSGFSEAVANGNCVILLDEANRIEPQLSNSLFPLLDHARRVSIHGVDIVCGPGIIFGHTMNIGVKYAGTNVVDAAWLNRMDYVDEVGALPLPVEIEMLSRRHVDVGPFEVKQTVSVMGELRKVVERHQLSVDVSTRTSGKVLRLIAYGMTIRQACRAVIETVCPLDERKPIIDALNNRLGVG